MYISRIKHITYLTDDFTRLYFGQEFCERLLPNETELEEAIRCAAAKKLHFTFVTPYVSGQGLDRLEKLLRLVAQNIAGAEVVFNDWGVFQLMREEYSDSILVMGRLLNKMKRGPRIMNIIDKVPQTTRDYYRKSHYDVAAVQSFLEDHGIYRVEFDNLLQGTDFSGVDPQIQRSLYIPFAFVSTTRFCLSANCENAHMSNYVGIVNCNRECQYYTFNLDNPVMGIPLIRKGNTVFFLNETIPDGIKKGAVDRIVVQPEIPL